MKTEKGCQTALSTWIASWSRDSVHQSRQSQVVTKLLHDAKVSREGYAFLRAHLVIASMTSSDLLFRTLKKLYQFSILAQNHVKTNRCRKNWSLTCCRRLRDVPDLQVTRLPFQSPQKVPQWRPASVPKLFPTWFASPGLRNPFWTRSLLSFWIILGWF